MKTTRFHTKICLMLGILAAASLFALPALSAEITLAWDPNTEPTLAGYKIHWGTSSGNYTFTEDLGNISPTEHTITGLSAGTTYYISATAYDIDGNDSGYSAEVTASIPAAETVSPPSAPIGNSTGFAGHPYSYSAASAVSSLSHSVQYRFSWGDGTSSGWLPAGTDRASKSWAAPGTYTTRVEARCAAHPTIQSGWSVPLPVTITTDGDSPEIVPVPEVPRGSSFVKAGLRTSYGVEESVSSTGEPLEYRFDWGDGSTSAWRPVGTPRAATSWLVAGVYSVRAQTRCAEHTSFVSDWSSALLVTVTGDDQPLPPPHEHLLFFDDFSDGNRRGDPDWERVSGKWSVSRKKALVSSPLRRNRIVVKQLDNFSAGRLETSIKLSLKGDKAPKGAVIFGYRDRANYRYVSLRKGKIVIGQFGDTELEKGGQKASSHFKPDIRKWRLLTVDVHSNGVVNAYINGRLTPEVTYVFNDLPPGKVGCSTMRAKTFFDNFVALDETVLP